MTATAAARHKRTDRRDPPLGWTVAAGATGRADSRPDRRSGRPAQSRAKIADSLKAASVRLVATSFFMMLRMCTFTVLSDIVSS